MLNLVFGFSIALLQLSTILTQNTLFNCTYAEECVSREACRNGVIVNDGKDPFKNSLIRVDCDEEKNMICCKRPKEKCGYGNVLLGSRIIGGADATFSEFPWNVAFLKETRLYAPFKSNYFCAGSLIHPRIVLTVAHCLANKTTSNMVVRAGQINFNDVSRAIMKSDDHKDLFVDRIIIHEEFSSNNLRNDIALLIMKEEFPMQDNIGIICLPNQNSNFDDQTCSIAGFGKVFDFGGWPINLQRADITIHSKAECETRFRSTKLGRYFELHDTFICAGGEAGVDACVGDGGGQLSCKIRLEQNRHVLSGMASWGIGCGLEGNPGAYVNVAKYRNWIDRKMRENSFTILHQV